MTLQTAEQSNATHLCRDRFGRLLPHDLRPVYTWVITIINGSEYVQWGRECRRCGSMETPVDSIPENAGPQGPQPGQGWSFIVTHREECSIVRHGTTIEVPVGDPNQVPLGQRVPTRHSATPCSCGGKLVRFDPTTLRYLAVNDTADI